MIYPAIETPNKADYLQVSEKHKIYWEECGNPDGLPIVFLHGGPGAGIRPAFRSMFDPEKFRIILFDQRGSGKSQPSAETAENTVDDLVSDMQALKKHLGVDAPWRIFGTSWGSTLAQKYAIQHPEEVAGLILNGVCFGDQPGARLLVDVGEASEKNPESFKIYADQNFVPEAFDEKGRIIPGELPKAYYKRLKGEHGADIQLEAARRFMVWNLSLMKVSPQSNAAVESNKDVDAMIGAANAHPENNLALSALFFHYYNTEYDPGGPDAHLQALKKSYAGPVHIIHGNDDMITPARYATQLCDTLPQKAELHLLSGAGHSKAALDMSAKIASITSEIADEARPVLACAFVDNALPADAGFDRSPAPSDALKLQQS